MTKKKKHFNKKDFNMQPKVIFQAQPKVIFQIYAYLTLKCDAFHNLVSFVQIKT